MLALKQPTVLLLVFGILLAAYFPTTSLLAEAWNSQSGYSHGPLVLLVSIWLVYREIRDRPLSLPKLPTVWLFGLIIPAGIAWVLAFLSATQAIHMLAFVVILYGAVSWVHSAESASRFLIPVGILVFSVPIWDVLTPTLQQLTIAVNSKTLSGFGWTALIVGDTVQLRSGTFQIAEGCGGTHFFVVALTLGVLYAHLNYRSFKFQVLFVLLAAMTAMLANWLRVFVIIIVGDATNMQHFLITVDHYYFGWIVFFLMIIPLFKLGAKFQVWDDRAALKNQPKIQSGIVPDVERNVRRRTTKYLISSAMLVLILLAPPIMASRMTGASPAELQSNMYLPDAIGAWRRVSESSHAKIPLPEFRGAQTELIQSYQRDGDIVVIYLNRYVRQRQGAELVGYDNSWYPDDWQAARVNRPANDVAENRDQLEVEQLHRAGDTKLMLHGYLVGHRFLVSELNVKLLGVVRTLLGDPVSGAVAIVFSCNVNCDQTRERAVEFVDQAMPILEDAIYGSGKELGPRAVHE